MLLDAYARRVKLGNSVVCDLPFRPHVDSTAIARLALQDEPRGEILQNGANCDGDGQPGSRLRIPERCSHSVGKIRPQLREELDYSGGHKTTRSVQLAEAVASSLILYEIGLRLI